MKHILVIKIILQKYTSECVQFCFGCSFSFFENKTTKFYIDSRFLNVFE